MTARLYALLWVLVPGLLLLSLTAVSSPAATGCDLNDPDRDIPRLFAESTSYKTVYASIQQRGGAPLLKRIEGRLGADNLPLYAPIDVPFTIYEIYQGEQKVGYVHGVNQKGQFGGIQVFVAQDLSARIKSFYIQKISGQMAGRFRDGKFYKQFIGITLKDFDSYDPITGKGSGRLIHLRNPAKETDTDFYGILRGLKKNLIIMDELVFSSERRSVAH